jgi:1-deoxyxylulose-5-phosphate synthase
MRFSSACRRHPVGSAFRPAQVALAWVMSRPGVAAPIVGTTKIEQLEEAIKASELKLDARTVKSLESAYRPRMPVGHA